MLQGVVNDTYNWFVGLVADRRNLDLPTARRLSDGSIYTGRRALELKLIDEVGGDREARAWLAAEKSVPIDVPAKEWTPDASIFSGFGTSALVGLARLVGLDPTAASILPDRLAVDGLLSLWQAPIFGRSDR
jgi:protease-4